MLVLPHSFSHGRIDTTLTLHVQTDVQLINRTSVCLSWLLCGSFSLINVGSGFPCLHSFFFFFSYLVVDLRDRQLEFWAPFSDGHPRERNSKTLTCQRWCALPAWRSLVTHSSYRLPDTWFFSEAPVMGRSP